MAAPAAYAIGHPAGCVTLRRVSSSSSFVAIYLALT